MIGNAPLLQQAAFLDRVLPDQGSIAAPNNVKSR
jgi:hypothetical protein